MNDDTREISGAAFTRAEAGLPEEGFVFCCFNNNYKITAEEFDIWMRLLNKVEGSVLWLFKAREGVEQNLRAEAKVRGVDPERLVFGERMPIEDHLARHRLADLFLDTFNCNAHTTASDALWAGLPVVTKQGKGFAARVASSLLHAVGLPELVTTSQEDYEALAFELATKSDKLRKIREKLAKNCTSAPLFDTELYTRHIEDAFSQIHRRRLSGLAPDTVFVSETPEASGPGKPSAPDVNKELAAVNEHYSNSQYQEAIDKADALLRWYPENIALLNLVGAAEFELGRPLAAIDRFKRVLEIEPNHVLAHNNIGLAYTMLRRLEEAEECFLKAISIQPDVFQAHANLGNIRTSLKQLTKAIKNYEDALKINPDYEDARARMLHEMAQVCDWDGVRKQQVYIETLGVNEQNIPPFSLLALEDDPQSELRRAEIFTRQSYTDTTQSIKARPPRAGGRIKIGYFSADFYGHATMCLMGKLFACHDTEQFEIHAFSYGPPADDGVRDLMKSNVEFFHDVSALGDREIAELSRNVGIDIAIDLKGHTAHNRIGIFSYGAAPVQVNYLGYPGSLGASFIDYIIADPVLIPEESRKHYSEKVVYLPHSYQVNDDTRVLTHTSFTRAQVGLPEDAFVFCSFNNNYKITPDEFDIWMRLLKKVDGSVLWQLKGNEFAEKNLKAEVEKRGVDPDRLVFADVIPYNDYLARQRVADLFLDTFKCNAHTTASDALWAGLPVVTKQGKGFSARVASSLLHAVGMPELVTHSAEEYEALALELATNPQKLAQIRDKLAKNRTTEPLFNTELFTRHIEEAYRQICKRYADGLKPDIIQVPE